jgi:hypothetical protein
MFISMIVVALVIAGVVMWQFYSAPSAPAAAAGAKNANTQHASGVPTADQMKQIQEWKKTHPGAYTKY